MYNQSKANPLEGTPRLTLPAPSHATTRKVHVPVLPLLLGWPLPHTQVAELIAGLEALGCERTRGEGQTLCVMSDSYNANGGVPALEASGDLPPLVDIVKVGG